MPCTSGFVDAGDTLFEVLFAGGRMAGGGNVVEDGKKLDTNVRAGLSAHTRPRWAGTSCSLCFGSKPHH